MLFNSAETKYGLNDKLNNKATVPLRNLMTRASALID
jgi:hypothetical protein